MTLMAERLHVRSAVRGSTALRYLPVTALLLDVALILGTEVLAVLGRRWVFSDATQMSTDLRFAVPVILVIWVAVLQFFGAYRSDVFGAGADEFKRVANGSLYALGFVGIGSYLAHYSLARGFFALLLVIGIPALLLGRRIIRRAVQEARVRGSLLERVVIAGSPGHVDEIAHVLRREPWLGYQVVGALCSTAEEETPGGVPVMGGDDPDTILRAAEDADVIFLAGGTSFDFSDMRQLQWSLERHATHLVVAPSVSDISSERVRVRPVGGLPLMHIDGPRWGHTTQRAKRLFDITIALTLLMLTAPLLLALALMVKLHDGGSVLFRQTRVGREGTTFECLKFRTMVPDAESMLEGLQANAGYTGGLFKLHHDPRITKPGARLRKYSLDELPQLINVLRGDMSLVGPRPGLVREVAMYDGSAHRRLHVRPGMTGLWQVSGRSDLSWEEAVRLDLFYVDNWSMLQDLHILAKTGRAIVAASGAY